MNEKLLFLLKDGADWVLYLLAALSFFSFALICFKVIQIPLIRRLPVSSRNQLAFQLQKGLDWLGIIGHQSPFIGLLGTVMGIMQSFQGMALQNNQGLSLLMKGISESLVTTGVGLLVALISLTSYQYFTVKKEQILFLYDEK